MTHPSESQRVERLIGLCKLWGAVKYFHPYLAYRHDIDWDAALVAAIPKVSAANSASDYAAAVQSMLAALGDPATRVIQPASVDMVSASASSSHESQPTCQLTPESILVITIHEYQDLADWFSAAQKIGAAKTEIPKARGILFDLRASAPPSQVKGNLTLAFQLSEIAAVLSTTPLVIAGERSRMHMGFVPQKGPSPYSSAYRVMDGRRITPAPEARDIPIVFLINGWSELPPEALALQTAGKAIVISEGSASDDSIANTHPIPLRDGVVAEIRLGEIVNADGSGGFLPDQILAPSQQLGEGDQALSAALELLKDFKPGKTPRAPLPPYAVPKPENSYPEMEFPPLEYRLLAVFRIWNIIHYFHPYKDLMGEDWGKVLEEFIPRMEQADSALSYHLAVAEMMTHIHDSHGFVTSPTLRQHYGSAWPPIRPQIIENTPVITTLIDEQIAKSAGVSCGDVILKIDGEHAMDRIAERAKYIAASTPQSLMYQAAWASLSGPEDSPAILTVRDRDQCVKEVKLPRCIQFEALFYASQRSVDILKLLTADIGYADLDRLDISMVDEMFEKFKDTKAIIFDMRGNPQGTMWSIAPRLAEESGRMAARAECPCVTTPDGVSDGVESRSFSYSIVQSIPPAEKWRYKGKTVMLIDERAISQAEHAGLLYEAANHTKFIGSHSAGANGDATNFNVPGDILIVFTGVSVRHADGRQLQRIGLVPDIEVKPTIEGIQNGKDEVLEGAIQYLQREIARTPESQKGSRS
jgi:C-terminal processing protease CtpA/Prc